MQLEGELAKAVEESTLEKQVLSAMARELVQPLTAVRLQTYMLRREACESCSDRLAIVERNVERFCALLDEMFAKLWNDEPGKAGPRLARKLPSDGEPPERPFFF